MEFGNDIWDFYDLFSSSKRTKSFAAAIAVILYYIMSFVSSKLFYAMEIGLTLSGIAILFGVTGVVGYEIGFFFPFFTFL